MSDRLVKGWRRTGEKTAFLMRRATGLRSRATKQAHRRLRTTIAGGECQEAHGDVGSIRMLLIPRVPAAVGTRFGFAPSQFHHRIQLILHPKRESPGQISPTGANLNGTINTYGGLRCNRDNRVGQGFFKSFCRAALLIVEYVSSRRSWASCVLPEDTSLCRAGII